MNTIMAIVLKVLFPHGLSLSYIMIYSVIFRNGPTNVSNSGKGVSVPCCVPPLPSRWGLGCNNRYPKVRYSTKQRCRSTNRDVPAHVTKCRSTSKSAVTLNREAYSFGIQS